MQAYRKNGMTRRGGNTARPANKRPNPYRHRRRTINEYILTRPPYQQPILRSVAGIIKQVIPGIEEREAYGLPTFWRGKNIISFEARADRLLIYLWSQSRPVVLPYTRASLDHVRRIALMCRSAY